MGQVCQWETQLARAAGLAVCGERGAGLREWAARGEKRGWVRGSGPDAGSGGELGPRGVQLGQGFGLGCFGFFFLFPNFLFLNQTKHK